MNSKTVVIRYYRKSWIWITKNGKTHSYAYTMTRELKLRTLTLKGA